MIDIKRVQLQTPGRKSSLTDEQMFEMTRLHGQAEASLSVEETMKHLSKDVFWEFVNVGLRIEGEAAVREWYRRILPVCLPSITGAEEKQVFFGPDYVFVEHLLTAHRKRNGRTSVGPHFTFYFFDADGLICGERAIMSENLTWIYADALEDDYENRPGVRRLYSQS